MKYKMHKIIMILCITVLLCISNTNYAIETSQYILENPEGFSNSLGENILTDAKGNSINVYVQENTEPFEYTQEFLEQVTNEIKNNIDEYRQTVAKEAKAQFADTGIDEEALNEYIQRIASKIEYKDFLVKELTTCSKNKYPCFHYISEISVGNATSIYTETYQIGSGKNANVIYTITISSADVDFFEKEEIKNAIDSFKIKDYERPNVVGMSPDTLLEEFKQIIAEKDVWGIIEIVCGMIAIVALCIALVGLLIQSIKKKKEKKNDESSSKKEE